MKQEDLISEAIEQAISKGIKIVYYSTFHWKESTTIPYACDAYGAVLLKLNLKLQPGHLKAVKDYLDVDWPFIYRFGIGFNNGRPLYININKNKDKPPIWRVEEISNLGVKLFKKYYKGND